MYSHADIAGWASVVVLAVLVITSDLRSRRVPNWLVAVGLVLSIVLVKFGSVVALAYDWRDVWLGGAIALAGFLPLYALGWMGAGDVKFFAVAGLPGCWPAGMAWWRYGWSPACSPGCMRWRSCCCAGPMLQRRPAGC
ncbi:hypothetical protein MAFF211471_42890 (plasmid) [Ralstonia solanacearum]|nr:hypothetical protein MAFF211471_42890 [Ralstonia solanacearum]BCN01762.1 hypothetical protein RPSA_42980 [Ralstonia solanacearum]